jgi:hypothetical protein
MGVEAVAVVVVVVEEEEEEGGHKFCACEETVATWLSK